MPSGQMEGYGQSLVAKLPFYLNVKRCGSLIDADAMGT
jgi:hypothetical protein